MATALNLTAPLKQDPESQEKLRHLAATTCGVVATIEPVVAAAAAWLWLDEVLSTTQVIGGAVVLCGVAVVEAARAPAPLPEPVAPGVA